MILQPSALQEKAAETAEVVGLNLKLLRSLPKAQASVIKATEKKLEAYLRRPEKPAGAADTEQALVMTENELLRLYREDTAMSMEERRELSALCRRALGGALTMEATART